MADEHNPLTIEYELNQDDAKEFAAWGDRTWPGNKLKAWGLLVLAAVFVIGCAWFFGQRLFAGRSTREIVGIAASLVSILAIIAALAFWTIRQVRERAAREKKQVSVTISPAGVTIKGEVGEGLIGWGEILEIVSTENHDYLVLAPRHAIVIPGRFFAHPEERQLYLEMAREYQRLGRQAAAEDGGGGQ